MGDAHSLKKRAPLPQPRRPSILCAPPEATWGKTLLHNDSTSHRQHQVGIAITARLPNKAEREEDPTRCATLRRNYPEAHREAVRTSVSTTARFVTVEA